MRRLPILALLALAAGCGRDLTLPAAAGAPRLHRVEPAIAIASLGTEVHLFGEDLASVEEVGVGPFVLRNAAVEHVSPGELVVRTAWIDPAALEGIDGEALQVRAFGPGGEVVAPEPLRLFSGAAHVDEIIPARLTPGAVIHVRGRGFDPDVIENNELRFGAAGSWCLAGEEGAEIFDPSCAAARIVWAAEGILVAEVPFEAPAGPVQVFYANRAFHEVEEALATAARGDEPLAGGDGGEEPPADVGYADGAAATDAYGAAPGAGDPGGGEGPAVRGEAAGLYVWREPGRLTVEGAAAPGATITVVGEGVLAYPDPWIEGALSPELLLLLDGAPLEALEAIDGWPEALRVTLPGDLAAGPHALQVVNPSFASPVAWLR